MAGRGPGRNEDGTLWKFPTSGLPQKNEQTLMAIWGRITTPLTTAQNSKALQGWFGDTAILLGDANAAMAVIGRDGKVFPESLH